MSVLRFPHERRYAWSPDRYQGEASVTILPIVPRFRPGFQRQNVRRRSGIAQLIKLKHPALRLPRCVEPPCDVSCEGGA